MIRTELRKWDKYEKKSEWKEFINSLSKEDYSIYQSYRGHRGNIVKVENKMKRLNNQLKELKETQNEYYKKMTLVNSQIDHLRKEFNISPNVSYWKKPIRRDNDGNRIVDNNEYFNGKIGRSGYKSIALECFVRPLGNAVLASCLTTEEFFQDVVYIEQQGDGSSVRAGVRHGSLFQVGYQFPNLVQIEGVVALD